MGKRQLRAEKVSLIYFLLIMLVKSASNCRAEDLNKNKLEISVNYWPVRYALNSIEHAIQSKNVFNTAQHRHD